eukprot:235363-Ditylum_brightwellii.AAC.1
MIFGSKKSSAHASPYAPIKYPLFCVTRTSAHLCPGIHAVPTAAKSSAAHALNTKEATPKGIPLKNWCGAEGSEAGAPPP